MKKLLIMMTALLLPCMAHAATPTQDQVLNFNLLPNSQYAVTGNVSTDDVSALQALLIGGESPLQILDPNGNILGQVPAQDLLDALTGLTGAATVPINVVIKTAGDAINSITARTLDQLPTVHVSNISVNGPLGNQAPTVTIRGKKKAHDTLRLRGTASDDSGVARVEVITNGRLRRAHGTASWHLNFALKDGRNRIVVRAFDNAGTSSAAKRVTVRD